MNTVNNLVYLDLSNRKLTPVKLELSVIVELKFNEQTDDRMDNMQSTMQPVIGCTSNTHNTADDNTPVIVASTQNTCLYCKRLPLRVQVLLDHLSAMCHCEANTIISSFAFRSETF